MSQVNNTSNNSPVRPAAKPVAPRAEAQPQSSDKSGLPGLDALSFAGLLNLHVQNAAPAAPASAAPAAVAERPVARPQGQQTQRSAEHDEEPSDDEDHGKKTAAPADADKPQAVADWLAALAYGVQPQDATAAKPLPTEAPADGAPVDPKVTSAVARRHGGKGGRDMALGAGAEHGAALSADKTSAVQSGEDFQGLMQAAGATAADQGRGDTRTARTTAPTDLTVRSTAAQTDAVKMLAGAGDAQAGLGQADPGRGGQEAAMVLAAQALGGVRAGQLPGAAPIAGSVAAPVGSAGFAGELGEHVKLMIDRAGAGDGRVSEAKLNLNPAEMGPITVRIALDGQGARVDFVAASEVTRQALSDSMPQLAAALQTEGLTLTGGGVHQQAQDTAGQNGQHNAAGQQGDTRSGGRAGLETTLNLPGGANGLGPAGPGAGRVGNGMLDLYA